MKHFRRPFLWISNGLVVLSSPVFFILGFAFRMIESSTRRMMSPAELLNADPFARNDPMRIVELCESVSAYCWFFGILFLVIGLVNFWLIPWRSLKPEAH